MSETGSMTSQLSLTTYYGIIKLLAACAAGSATVAQTLLEAGILDVLCRLITNSSLLSASAGTTAVMRSPDQLFEVLGLACQLLPSIPESAQVILQGQAALAAAGTSGAQPCARSTYLSENPVLMKRMSAELLPLLLQIFSTTVMPQVGSVCSSCCCRSGRMYQRWLLWMAVRMFELGGSLLCQLDI